MKIMRTIKSAIPKTPVGILTKAAGLAALGYVAYDSHYVGKLQSDLYSSEKDADSSLYYLNNSLYSSNMSKVQDGIRNTSFEMELDQGWKRFFNSGIGYIKGFGSMLVEHVVPLGLGLGALLGKGLPSKACAGGLGIYAAFTFAKNFFGFGTPKGLDRGV